MKPFVAVACFSCVVLLAAGTRAADVEQLAPRVLRELKTSDVPCPDDLTSEWTCGQYRHGFSRLKFELEVELDLKEYDARPLNAWRLRDGRYERAWAVHGSKVTMKFGRTNRIVALSEQPLDEEPADREDGDDDDDDDDDDRGA